MFVSHGGLSSSIFPVYPIAQFSCCFSHRPRSDFITTTPGCSLPLLNQSWSLLIPRLCHFFCSRVFHGSSFSSDAWVWYSRPLLSGPRPWSVNHVHLFFFLHLSFVPVILDYSMFIEYILHSLCFCMFSPLFLECPLSSSCIPDSHFSSKTKTSVNSWMAPCTDSISQSSKSQSAWLVPFRMAGLGLQTP